MKYAFLALLALATPAMAQDVSWGKRPKATASPYAALKRLAERDGRRLIVFVRCDPTAVAELYGPVANDLQYRTDSFNFGRLRYSTPHVFVSEPIDGVLYCTRTIKVEPKVTQALPIMLPPPMPPPMMFRPPPIECFGGG